MTNCADRADCLDCPDCAVDKGDKGDKGDKEDKTSLPLRIANATRRVRRVEVGKLARISC